jgi:hypothetical protein
MNYGIFEYLCMARITLRVLTPRGHISWHLPQSIHFSASKYSLSVSPRLINNINCRKLSDVNRPAEQVTIQVPHPIHAADDGSCRNICPAISLDIASISILLLWLMLYPKSIFDF